MIDIYRRMTKENFSGLFVATNMRSFATSATKWRLVPSWTEQQTHYDEQHLRSLNKNPLLSSLSIKNKNFFFFFPITTLLLAFMPALGNSGITFRVAIFSMIQIWRTWEFIKIVQRAVFSTPFYFIFIGKSMCVLDRKVSTTKWLVKMSSNR